MKHILVAFLSCVALTANSQSKVPILFRGDFGMSNVKTNSGKADGTFALGAGVEGFLTLKKLVSGLSVQLTPNLSYLHTGYETSLGGDVKVNYVTLGLPLSIAINDINSRERLGYLLGVGPYISYAANGKFRNLAGDDYKKMSFGSGTADNRKTTDAGVLIKSAFKAGKAYLGIQYNLGTANVIPDDRITNGSYIKTRNFLFYISFKL